MTDYYPGLTSPPDLSLVVLAIYMLAALVGSLVVAALLAVLTLPAFFAVIFAGEGVLRVAQNTGVFWVKMLLLMLRSLRRNLLRTSLTYVALFVFTMVLTLIYSVVSFLTNITAEKQTDVKVIVSEKFQFPSMMPPRYVGDVKHIIETELPPQHRPASLRDDVMIWAFAGGSLDPNVKSIDNSMFLMAMEPHSLLTMMDGLGPNDISAADRADLTATVAKMQEDKRNIIVGKDKLAQINKKVGDEIKIYSMNYPDIVFEFKIVGAYPDSRHNNGAAMRYDYLRAKLDDYKIQKGKDHPMADRSLGLIWVRLPDKAAFEQLAAIVNQPGKFSAPAVKMETASAGIGSFLDSFKDILWGVKYVLMPSLAVIMALVVSITLTISVRERWTEMAVLKVLGFQPRHVFAMVIGEGMLIGLLGGGLCTWLMVLLFNYFFKGGLRLPIGFFGNFQLNEMILVYGPVLGLTVALVGSFLPAWSARGVKASNVFSQVA
jgi:putative ABC transport system permease protein